MRPPRRRERRAKRRLRMLRLMLKLFLVVIYILVNSDKLFGANYFTILIKRKREGRLRKPPKND